MGSNTKFGLPYPHLTQICRNLQLFLASSVFHPSSSSPSPLSVTFKLEISFTSLSYCHTCTRIWLLKQYFDSHFFRYFTFSFNFLRNSSAYMQCTTDVQVFFFHKHFTQFNTVIVIVLVQVPSLLSSCALRMSKTRFLLVMICQDTPRHYICSHFSTHKPSAL